MGGAMISETIFNVHGIGYLTYQSILKGEGNLGGVHRDAAHADLRGLQSAGRHAVRRA